MRLVLQEPQRAHHDIRRMVRQRPASQPRFSYIFSYVPPRYVSKRPQTSWSSASDDYYCAYDSDHSDTKHQLLPPFRCSWTVRDCSGILSRLTGGCGVAPAPAFTVALDDMQSVRGLLLPHVPPAVRVIGCGLSELNGTYVYSHLVNDRPCWLLQRPPDHMSSPPSSDQSQPLHRPDTQAALWFFASTSSLSHPWNGWYISTSPNTSSVSASDDFYSSYSDAPLPPESGKPHPTPHNPHPIPNTPHPTNHASSRPCSCSC
jgi:hypothetical protein